MGEEAAAYFSTLKVWGDIIRPDTIHRGMNCVQKKIKCPNRAQCSHTCLVTVPRVEGEQPDIRALDWRMENGERIYKRWYGRNTLLKENIDNRVILILQKVWHLAHHDTLIMNNSKYIVTVTVLAELWGFVTKLYDEEFSKIDKLKLPRYLCEKFSKVLFILEETNERFENGLKTLSRLVRLRTAVVEDVRLLYRQNYLGLPQVKLPNRANRYNPYDVDWLTSSTKLYEKMTHWPHVSRINQWHQLQHRVDSETVRLSDGTPEVRQPDARFEFDPCSPFEDMDPETLDGVQIQDYEQNEWMKTLHKIHNLELKGYNNHILTESKKRYSLLNMKHTLLLAKRVTAGSIFICHRENFNHINLLQQLAILAVLETQMLLLSETLAQFNHQIFGMFGQSFPTHVSHAIERVICFTKDENCTSYPLSEDMISMLDNVRMRVKDTIKTFFLEQEELLEEVDVDPVFISKSEVEKITLNIPQDMQPIRKKIIANLVWENIEGRRLAKELEMAHKMKLVQTEDCEHVFTNSVPGMHFSNFPKIIFKYQTRSFIRRSNTAAVWEDFTAYKKKYPSELREFIKEEIRCFVSSTFGRTPMQVANFLASAFCSAIIDNVYAHEVNNMMGIIKLKRCRKRILYAAKRCIGVFESVVKVGVALMKDRGDIQTQAYKRYKESDPEHSTDPNRTQRTYIPPNEMFCILNEFMAYMEYVAYILKQPFDPLSDD